MALQNFSTEQTVIIINGRQITDWGDTDPPYTDAPIDPKATLRRGLGGRGVRLDRINPGRTVTLNLNPGSPDSAFLHGLMLSKANITMGKMIIGTLEVATGDQGVIVNDGPSGRAGTTITDDQYTIEYNVWTDGKGGE